MYLEAAVMVEYSACDYTQYIISPARLFFIWLSQVCWLAPLYGKFG